MSDRFMRGVILIRFQRAASQPGDGLYVVRLPATSTNADLFAAIAALNRMPEARYAIVDAVRTGG